MDQSFGRHILIFLPQAAASLAAARLNAAGYRTSVTPSVSDLHEALVSTDHKLAITTGRDRG